MIDKIQKEISGTVSVFDLLQIIHIICCHDSFIRVILGFFIKHISSVFGGRMPSLVIADPKILRQIMIKDFGNFVNRQVSGSLFGGQDRVAIKRPLRNDKEVVSNSTAIRNKNWTLGRTPAQKVAVQQDLSGRPAI